MPEDAPRPLDALAGALRDEGGLLAGILAADRPPADRPPAGRAGPPIADDTLGRRAAAGARTRARGDAYALVVEAIREGALLHYGTSRVLDVDDDDLALLAGDRLYALGLARLADLEDLEAVAELADVISLTAQAHAEQDPDRADVVWEAGAAVIADGPDPDHEKRKAQWRGAR